MNVVVRASVILAAVVTLLIILIAVTGLHQSSIFIGLAAIVLFTLINVVMVYWALSGTAAENGYGRQLGNAMLIGLIGGALICASSWILMSVVFPNYTQEAGDAALEFMASAGMSEEQIEAQAEKIGQATSFGQALQGAMGTFFTSLIAGAIIAVFKRRK